jgi:hypothetical protein
MRKKRQSDRLISTLAEYHHQQLQYKLCGLAMLLPYPAKSGTAVPVTLPASIEGQGGDFYLKGTVA